MYAAAGMYATAQLDMNVALPAVDVKLSWDEEHSQRTACGARWAAAAPMASHTGGAVAAFCELLPKVLSNTIVAYLLLVVFWVLCGPHEAMQALRSNVSALMHLHCTRSRVEQPRSAPEWAPGWEGSGRR